MGHGCAFIAVVVAGDGSDRAYEQCHCVCENTDNEILAAVDDLAKRNPGKEVQIVHQPGRFVYDVIQ